jgi:coniferyl-aldehyde dehydrogenase
MHGMTQAAAGSTTPRTNGSESKSARAAEILEAMKKAQRGKAPPTYEERIARLESLEASLLKHKKAVCDAIAEDFGNRSRHESLIAEVFVTESAIKHARTNLRDWMDPEDRAVEWTFLPGTATVFPQPLGVIGIISPWNYPVGLALSPLVAALAAGNRAMIKPSELVPATSEVLARIVEEAFDRNVVTVVTGGPEVGEAFAKLPFDHLVFTGSTRVGKLVMRAAAENLTPLTLELGGKSPTIVADDFSLETAATRIVWGKLFNAGQTCIAPDYVLLPSGKRDAFVEACKEATKDIYPTLATNPDYTTIVSDRHYQRLQSYLDDARQKGGKTVEINPAKETLDPTTRKMTPTLLLDPREDMIAMQEEIFGPILPIMTYKTLDEAIAYVNDHPRPLALYVFTHDATTVDRVTNETMSGGLSVNETMLHYAQDDLPFGGVGPSGMGHYHAREGFEQFTKKRPVFRQGRINATGLMRAPYDKSKVLDLFLRFTIGK